MALRICCPSCNFTGQVPDQHSGKMIQCPRCKTGFRAGPAGPAVPPAANRPAASRPAASLPPPTAAGRPPNGSQAIRPAAANPPMPAAASPRAPAAPAIPPPAVRKSSGGWIVMAVLGVAAVGGLGAGGFWMLSNKSPGEPGPAVAASSEPAPDTKIGGSATEPTKTTPPQQVAQLPENAKPQDPKPQEPKPQDVKPQDPKPQEPAPAPATIPVATLQALKDATVFVKVDAGAVVGSGSGFVMQVDGETAYIVTNQHVAAPASAKTKPTLTIVFGSGTEKERSAKAEVVGVDAERDLAILKVSGVKDLPKSVEFSKTPELIETMPVLVFGFPFGQLLSTGKGNPAITVAKGSVSSIRKDEHGRLQVVQIDGALNPGNSGGPVVDSNGRLVGVAVATIRGANIGLAIPPDELRDMLAGRVIALGVYRKSASETAGEVWLLNSRNAVEKTATRILPPVPAAPRSGTADVLLEAQLLDPLNRLRVVQAFHIPVAQVKQVPQAEPDGTWRLLPESQKIDLPIREQKASATLSVPDAKGAEYYIQLSFETTGGKPVFTQPRLFRLDRTMSEAMVQDTGAAVPRGPLPVGWREFSPKDKSFSVWVPEGGRSRESERNITVRGTRLKINTVTVQQNPAAPTYTASTLILPLALARKIPVVERLELIRDSFVEEFKGKVTDEKDIKLGSLPGKEYLIEGRVTGRLRVFAYGSRIYEATVIGSKGQVSAPDATTFLDSYRLPEKAPTDNGELAMKDPPAPSPNQPAPTPSPNQPDPAKPDPAKPDPNKPAVPAKPGQPLQLGDEQQVRHRGTITAVAISPDGKLLFSCDNSLELHDISFKEPKALVTPSPTRCRALTFTRDGKMLAIGSWGPTGTVLNVTVNQPQERMVTKGHDFGAACVAFHPNGKLLATGGDDGGVFIWDVSGAQPKEVAAIKAGGAGVGVGVGAMAYTPDGKTLAVATWGGGTFTFYDVTGATPKPRSVMKEQLGLALAISPDGKLLARGANDKSIHVYSMEAQPRLKKVLQGHEKKVTALAFAADSRTLASCGEDGKLCVWDAVTGQQRYARQRPQEWQCIAIHQADPKVDDFCVAGGNANSVFVYRLNPDGKAMVAQETRVPNTLPMPPKPAEPDPKKPAEPAKKPEGDIANLVASAAGAVKDNKLGQTAAHGFALNVPEFKDVSAEGGLLIGFSVTLGKFVNDDTIGSLQPIYLTATGEKRGPQIGKPQPRALTVKARPGYAVGAITLKTGLVINGFSVTFMKVTKDGLDKTDSYTSEWMGGMGGSPPKTLSAEGAAVVGICGHRKDGASMCSALGLVFVK